MFDTDKFPIYTQNHTIHHYKSHDKSVGFKYILFQKKYDYQQAQSLRVAFQSCVMASDKSFIYKTSAALRSCK